MYIDPDGKFGFLGAIPWIMSGSGATATTAGGSAIGFWGTGALLGGGLLLPSSTGDDALPPGIKPGEQGDFPRDGVIPGTIEHRGELNTPSTPMPGGQDPNHRRCVEKAKYKYEQCKSSCSDKSQKDNCWNKYMLELLQCQEDRQDPPNFGNDGPSYDAPDLDVGGFGG